MMSQLSTKTNVNVFDGNNFQAWKLDTIAILEAKRCYIVTCKGIDPSYTEDSESSSSSSSSSEEDVLGFSTSLHGAREEGFVKLGL